MKKISYDISEVVPYINWLYFYHAWGLSGKKEEEKQKMRQEAEEMLSSWEGKYHTHALLKVLDAYSEGDDIIVETGNSDELNGCADAEKKQVRLPLLRQQHPSAPGAPNLCLADFICPRSLQVSGAETKTEKMLQRDIARRLGVFCCTVEAPILNAYRNHEYLGMMAQLLCDRLAEATAELLHEQTRKTYWGYAPDEHLTPQQLHREEYQGIRPAIGYPSLPDTSFNFIIDQLLDMKQVGIRLTETGMMTPHSSVSGLMFAHPKAQYFELGKIGEDQLRDYAHRRGVPVELMRRFLQSSLLKR